MGIDIYLEWDGMEEEEKQAQATGFSVTSGNVGYLREAYHGGPYATRILVREAFDAEDCRAEIPAAVLRERLTRVTEPSYGSGQGHALAEQLVNMFVSQGKDVGGQTVQSDTTRPMTVEEAIAERQRRLYPDDSAEMTKKVTKSFRDFVALAEEKERQRGKPCTIYASY
ncbi:hypothetical protein EBZ80_24225 [bacterium]|nr:hypothetical protein [Betaproteobacteria bacterium]NDE18030.1 hypothetical protein [bacterium]